VEDATATGTSSVANWFNSASDVFLCSALAFYQKSSGGAGIGTTLTTETFGARIMSPRTSIIGTGQKTGIYR
jgi:hypothetical protein